MTASVQIKKTPSSVCRNRNTQVAQTTTKLKQN